MAYTPYYSGGWQSGEEGNTPITPAALNNMEQGITDANALGDPVTVAHGGTGGASASVARTNLQASTDICLDSSDNTVSEIYTKLSRIPTYHTATIYISTSSVKILSNNKITSISKGIVTRHSDNTYDFMVCAVLSGNNLAYIFTWRVTILTSSAITVDTVYRYAGTAI